MGYSNYHTCCIIPGSNGKVTGGKSSVLGRNPLKSMGVQHKMRWTGYQAQHIIPAELRDHPVLRKIGMNLNGATVDLWARSLSRIQ